MAAINPLIKRACLFALVAACIFIAACETGVQKRPIGWHRLGKAQDLLAAETFVDSQLLLLRHDERGFSVMSTACTYDLSPLVLRDGPNGRVFVSRYSESQYAESGKLLHGPAKVDLPYYQITLDAGVAGGPKDTLYVQVGVEKPRDWRLQIDSK